MHPWVVGGWGTNDTMLALYPDGYYYSWDSNSGLELAEGDGWRLAPFGGFEDAFTLSCGDRRFVVRSQWGSGAMDLLSQDGQVHSQLQQVWRSEGPIVSDKPHGTWQQFAGVYPWFTLDYRNGELVDAHGPDGKRDWLTLHTTRRARRLSVLTKRDFPDEAAPEEKR